jgi:hypothetical protein
MIFSKLFRRGQDKDKAQQPAAPASVNPLDQPYEQPASGVDPMAEKIPADPNSVQADPGPGDEVRLPVDPTRPH